MYTRIIYNDIITHCFQHKAIILYGPRQVGKTTLVRQIQKYFTDKSSLYISGDDREIQQTLEPSLRILSIMIAPYDIVVIDEAQRIPEIWLIIKLLVDNFPNKQIIATGSSSFDLANKTSEPLTGRSYIYKLYPLSIEETSPHDIISLQLIQQRLIYGSYPDVIVPKYQLSEDYLNDLINNYLYKDLMMVDGIKKTHLIIKILQALALQIGNEFSYNEIATTVGADKWTVEKYINILEQAYIISLLHPLHTNQRREIKSNKKVYFWDLWVRNALLGNFSPLHLRNDVWALRENFFFIERSKHLHYHKMRQRQYFWRWTDAWEIDFVETKDNYYGCFECKFSDKKWWSLPNLFTLHYKNATYTIINPKNIGDYIR